MAFSVSTDRSRPQESPMLWLSLVAGSLLVHLAALLIGRWYFSQAASAPAGMAQAPLDFVEIDPNAPVLKRPIAPTQTQTTPSKTIPPQTAPVEPTQSPSLIESLTRQAELERIRSEAQRSQPRNSPAPSPTPVNPVNPPRRSQPDQLPSDRTIPKRNPTAPFPSRPTTNPVPTPGGSNPTQPSPGSSPPGTTVPSPGSSNPTQPQPGTPSNPTTGTPGDSATGTPSNPTTGNPSNPTTGDPKSPATSGDPLSISTDVRGEVYGNLSEVGFNPGEFARGTVSLKSPPQFAIKFDYPSKLPVSILDLRVGLKITKEGQVVYSEVLDDSPSLQQDPKLKDSRVKQDIQSIVQNLILNANADGSLAFNVDLDSRGLDAYRIMNLRININQ